MAKNKKQRRYIFVFFLILFIGSTGVYLTKTDVGFNIVYQLFRQKINREYDFHLSIEDLNTPFRTNLEANYLKFANDDSTLVVTIDTLDINYKGIFELLGRKHLDKLQIKEPNIYVKIDTPADEAVEFPGINFPNFLVNVIQVRNAKFQIEMTDTTIFQTIDLLECHYSGKKGSALLSINDLKMKNDDLGIKINGLSSEIVFKNNIAKLRNLNFLLNDSEISSNGKIRYVEPFRFQFAFNVRDFKIEDYIQVPMIKEQDKIDLSMDIMGDFDAFTATVELKGILNNKKIDYSTFNIEFKDDYLHLLQASFKNENTDISLYGSYGLVDKYITTTFTSYNLDPSDWFETIPEFDFQGRMRATGYLDERMRVNYDFSCLDLYGLETVKLGGDIIFDGLDNIMIDSSNYIYLPDGLLKARGSIVDLQEMDLDIYGDIASLGGLDIPSLGKVNAKDIYLTLKILGNINDPDIQMNFNLDSLNYNDYAVNNLNVSLFSKQTISQPGGALLVSFENAMIDSFPIGEVQTYIRVEEDMVYLDYFDINSENYNMSFSGDIKDFREFSINELKGSYQDEDIYLLDPVTFNITDDGYSLSRYDILYRDALLYGELDIKNDSINGSINIAGAELNSLPLLSTMMDSIEGRLDLNMDIRGGVDNPEITLGLLLKNASAFGLDAQRIRSKIHFNDSTVFVDNFNIAINDERNISLKGEFPIRINFKDEMVFKILYDEPLIADLDVNNARLSKLLPFIFDFRILGNADAKGRITGTFNDPVMDADLFVRDPVVMKIEGDSIKSVFHYSNERMFFNDVKMYAGNGFYEGDANFFMDMRLQPEGQRFYRDSSLYVYVNGTDDEMIYLTPFIDPMEDLRGELFTELEMKGNFNKTIKNGKVTIKNGRLVLDILGNEVENIDGEAVMTDNIMNVDLKGKLPSVAYTLAGILGLEENRKDNKYNFDISGNMDMRYLIKPEFNLQLTGDQMSIVTLDEKVNLTSGEVDLQITGRDTLNISGDVTVQEGMIEFGFNRLPAKPETTAPAGEEPYLRTEYSLNAIIDKIYFRNQFIDATLNGEMILQKFPSENRTRMGGQLDVTDGFFNYWASVFVLDEGSLILDQFENNHELNFIARKNITDQNGNRNEIIASITGELNNPEITFSDENNELSQAQIVEALTVGEIRTVLGDVTGGGNGNLLGSATTALLNLAEVPLEQQARRLGGVGGLDRIDIIGGEGTYIDETTALVIGGRIGRNFYLTYEGSQEKPVNIEYEYRLNNKVSIVGSASDEKVDAAVRLRLQY